MFHGPISAEARAEVRWCLWNFLNVKSVKTVKCLVEGSYCQARTIPDSDENGLPLRENWCYLWIVHYHYIYIYITMVGKMSHLTFRGMLLKVFIGKNKHGVFPPSWMVQTGWLGGGWHFDLLTHWNSWSCWKRSTAELELMNLRTTSWCQLNVAHSAAGLWSFSVPFFAHGKRSFLRLLPALQRSQGGSERGESLGDWAAAGSSTVVWADGSQWWRLHFSGRVRLDGPPANQGALWISDLLSPWVLISCKSIISGMGQSLWNWGITIHSPAKL